MSYIEDIFIMDNIFSIEQKVEQEYGINIPNVSHWDSSSAFQKHMAQALVMPPQSLPWNYYYTYSISTDNRQQVLKNLGIPQQQLPSTMGLLLQSGTVAIVNMINLLIHFNRKYLCILQPAYFSVASCCSMLSLKYHTEQTQFANGRPQIPVEKIIASGYDCVWITSPIFCTGYYPDQEYLKDIAFLKASGITIVFDECLALPGKELLPTFPIDRNIFAIYSPHKALSINGLKFAVIVCDKFYEDFLEQWIDVFSGALSVSNRDAIFHYISKNYLEECYSSYKSYIYKTKTVVENIIKQCPFASTINNTDGHYITIFLDLKIQTTNELLSLMKNIIRTTFASFIPSVINGFNANQGFGFRVNLTGDIFELEYAITRILQYLNEYH